MSSHDEVIEASESKREKELKEGIELLGEDKDNYDLSKETTYEVSIPKETSDKILRISRMVKVATLTIQGYEEQPDGETKSSTFKLTKQPLASTEVIKTFQTLLEPYADESNMVTKKTWDSFKIQAESDWGAFYKLCLREKASPEQNERTVQRAFQSCIINIGEITCDNPGNMGTLFGTINDDRAKEDVRNPYQ